MKNFRAFVVTIALCMAFSLCCAMLVLGHSTQGVVMQPTPQAMVYDDEADHCADVGTLARTDIGDEFISLSNLLGAYCGEVKVGDVYLSFNFGEDGLEDFVGDPMGNGYALPPATVIAANNYMACHAINVPYRASNESGTSWEDAIKLVEGGTPTLIWLTEDLGVPTDCRTDDEGQAIYDGMATYVVTKVANGEVTMVSPTQGAITTQESNVRELYDACGQRLVVMRRVP